ncbi:hypothetical protein KUCAC02_012683 [Chaenocephalus aceratus]|uniref:Uncharacterized protein n=1 Tax=Chaenocephalus aceratus TaxID=36190 RepID=A0ACB9XC87_CHAAC|nr:hypothetical protein KUCAC02_012683 [Chaenocephalus aceratus]
MTGVGRGGGGRREKKKRRGEGAISCSLPPSVSSGCMQQGTNSIGAKERDSKGELEIEQRRGLKQREGLD